ncbi:hypothetical protein ACIPIN_01835 [Pseudomonas sp. NPDC087697]|uniref:hypothetical protein n=1 Tax=Pseudomonas sp. NPDC087697 TaxID=3364447 RepID=UPI003813A650
MLPEPGLAINKLSEDRLRLWHKIAETHFVDELEIRRLFNRIDNLLIDPGVEFTVASIALHEQAYLFAYQMKTDNSLHLFKDAQRAGLDKLAVSISTAHALYICGEIEMSKDEILRSDISDAENAGLSGLADSCVHTGLLQKARDLYIRSGKQKGEVSTQVIRAAEIMDQIGANDDQVVRRIATAARVIKSMSTHPFIAYDLFAMHDEGILYRFVVKGSTERLVEIDMAIDEALLNEFDEEIDEVLSIGLAPYELGANILAADGYYVGV